MLAAPLKKTKQLDWVEPLRSYLHRNYPEREANEQNPSIQRLANARARVQAASGPDSKAFESLGSYLEMLTSVEPRFPIDENQSIKMQFQWSDSFKPSKKITHTNVAYERACVMFNLGALESHAGMSQDRSDPAGLKKACAHFSTAAGIFSYIRDDLRHKINGPVTSDLSTEGLTMLHCLMLAQAQACYYEQALKKKSKPSVLSKVAAQAADWYNQAMTNASMPSLSAVLDKSWMSHLQFQFGCFNSSAEYQLGKQLHLEADATGDGYGEEIARYHRAEVKCTEAINTAKKNKLPSGMLGTVQHLLSVIQRDKSKAMQDNDSIYLQPIPNSKNLTPPSKIPLAKATVPSPSLTNLTLKRGDDVLFGTLLPVNMHEAEAKYQSKLQMLIGDSAENVMNKAEEVRVRLAEAGLPQAVEAGDTSKKGFPDAVYERVTTAVHSCGGVEGLYSRINENESLSQNVVTLLNGIEESLKAEESEDSAARSKWNAKWTATPSFQLSAHMREDINRYRRLVEEARSSDKLVESRMTSNNELLSRVKMSKSDLDQMIPNPQDLDDNPEVERLRAELSILLVELGSLVNSTEARQADLITASENDSIVAALTNAPEGAEAIVSNDARLEEVFREHLQKYKPITDEISRLIESFYPMLSKILDKNFKYAEIRVQNDVSRLREAVVSEVNSAISVFEEINHHVQEGSKFWNELSTRCEQLQTTVADHCFVREMERKEELHRLDMEQTYSTHGNRPGVSREVSTPTISPYAVGGVATGVPVQPQASYPSFGGGQQSTFTGVPVGGQSTDNGQTHKFALMRGAVGPNVSDEQLQFCLEVSAGDVEAAINLYLEQNPGQQRQDKPQQQQQDNSQTKKKKKNRFGF